MSDDEMSEAERVAATSETVWDAFTATAKARPDAPFFCVPARAGRGYAPEGFELTYGEAAAKAQALAAQFLAKGYGPGARVALMLDNRPEHVITQLALYAAGASRTPVNPDYTDDELSYLLSHSEADLIVALPHNIDMARRVAGALDRSACLFNDLADAPANAAERSGPTGRGAETELIYTSGTTGRPKGCVIDNDYHFAVGLWYAGLGGRISLRQGQERLFVPLPLFHVNAGINTFTAMILTANCLIMPDRFHAGTWWRDLAETRATGFHYLGLIPPVLMKRPPEPAETGHNARFGLGAGVDPQIHQAFEARFGVPMVEVWGMTETGRFLADHEEPRRIDTRAFGRPRAEMEARIEDEKGGEAPYGAPGELVVRCA
ncbi:MAG: AMP-binding protein, partial [Pseudomonadota bacterium]